MRSMPLRHCEDLLPATTAHLKVHSLLQMKMTGVDNTLYSSIILREPCKQRIFVFKEEDAGLL